MRPRWRRAHKGFSIKESIVTTLPSHCRSIRFGSTVFRPTSARGRSRTPLTPIIGMSRHDLQEPPREFTRATPVARERDPTSQNASWFPVKTREVRVPVITRSYPRTCKWLITNVISDFRFFWHGAGFSEPSFDLKRQNGPG
jgi:hypothetical protein